MVPTVLNPIQLRTWDEIVQAGVNLKTDLDRTHLTLGALANFACPDRKGGNPNFSKQEGEKRTITALAFAIGIDRAWLSNAANNARFWHGHFEKIPPQATIGQLNAARKAVGWKPGTKVTAALRKQALDFLIGKIEAPPKAPPAPLSLIKSARASLDRALKGLKGKSKTGIASVVSRVIDMLDEILGDDEDGGD